MAAPPAPLPTTTASACSVRSGPPATSLKLVTIAPQPLGLDQLHVLDGLVTEVALYPFVGVVGEQAQPLQPLHQIAPKHRPRVQPAIQVAAPLGERHRRKRSQARGEEKTAELENYQPEREEGA